MQLAEFYQSLQALGAKSAHVDRILRAWLQAKPLDAGTRRQASENFLPLAVREALPELTANLGKLARVIAEHPGEDGARLLVALADGQTVESVLLPRGGVCISSQIGCAVGCTFCMTGKQGLLRQVSSAEMIAQVVLARQRRAVRRVVFMGMGEPSHNLDQVLEAINLLGTAGGIGHKNLVFSTVGDLRVFERLPQQRVIPALAISLHSTDAGLRRHLLPNADNATASLDYRRPSVAALTAMARHLHDRGIRTTVRNSVGQDVDGGCGQLRARHLDGSVAPPRQRRGVLVQCVGEPNS
ncbi:MAG: radical SAM protein [Azonexus sp.]|nr:radical SAM protein [Azonexus sp.]